MLGKNFLTLPYADTGRHMLRSTGKIAKRLPENQWIKLKEEVAIEIVDIKVFF